MNNEYEKQAKKFLKNTNTELNINFDSFGFMNWDEKKHTSQRRAIFKCTLINHNGTYIFDYGDSIHNTFKNNPDLKPHKVQKPSAYDILSCLTVRYYESADEVYEEFGEMKPSQAQEIFEEGQNLQKLFTEVQLEELNEIT